jgi:hypothetical protein
MPSGAAPLVIKLEAELPASATGASASGTIRVPFDGTVTSVTYAPVAAITGAATNNRTISVVNHGQAGAGTTVMATLTYNSGTNSAAFDENAIPLSGVALATSFVAGDILEVKSVFNGTGIADPGGTVFVEVSRD